MKVAQDTREIKYINGTHSSVLAWKIPWTEEPGGLQSMGSLRVGRDWATSLSCIGEGNGNPLQCSCLENPRDGAAWWATVYGVAQSQTRLKRQQQQQQQQTVSHCSLLTGANVQISGPNCISWSLVLDRKMSFSCTLRARLDFRKPSVFVFCCCVTGHHALGRYRAQIPWIGSLGETLPAPTVPLTQQPWLLWVWDLKWSSRSSSKLAGRFPFLVFPLGFLWSFWLYPSLDFLTAAHGPSHMGPPPQGSVPPNPQSQQGSTVAAAFCKQEQLGREVMLPTVDSLWSRQVNSFSAPANAPSLACNAASSQEWQQHCQLEVACASCAHSRDRGSRRRGGHSGILAPPVFQQASERGTIALGEMKWSLWSGEDCVCKVSYLIAWGPEGYSYCCLVATWCLATWYPIPGSSVHGTSQVRILEWVAISSSRGSSRPRDWTWVSYITGRFFTTRPHKRSG